MTFEPPDQTGRLAIVTGGNSGIGYGAAKRLLDLHATVVLACRSTSKGAAARDRLKSETGSDRVEIAELDLADLSSVAAFADRWAGRPIDVLINNAGVMMPPGDKPTRDGFETTMAVNHFGPFALTARLLPAVVGRVVTVSSIAHRSGVIDFAHMTGPSPMRSFARYRQSKLANLLFAFELDRRLKTAGRTTISVAAHPGVSVTPLFVNGPGARLGRLASLINLAVRVVGQSASRGALPTVRATVDPGFHGGEYVGPDGPGELRGDPVLVRAESNALDVEAAQRLWSESERLTGVRFGL